VAAYFFQFRVELRGNVMGKTVFINHVSLRESCKLQAVSFKPNYEYAQAALACRLSLTTCSFLT